MSERHADFETLLAQHAGIVAKVARLYGRDADDRRDLAQEIATQLWRAFPRFDEQRGKFSTWMYRIALNVGISHLRSARAVAPLDDDTLAAAPAEPDDRAAALYARIRELEPLARALVMLYLEDRSYAEIAEVLGITEANVATKLSRLKTRLRAQLTGAAYGSR
jgi:RNA polymerase sigma factor (sigma-70 family)